MLRNAGLTPEVSHGEAHNFISVILQSTSKKILVGPRRPLFLVVPLNLARVRA